MRYLLIFLLLALLGLTISSVHAQSFNSLSPSVKLTEVVDPITPVPSSYVIDGQVLNTVQFEAKKEIEIDQYISPTSTFTDNDINNLLEILNQELRKGKIKASNVDNLDDLLTQIK